MGRPSDALLCFRRVHKVAPDVFSFEGIPLRWPSLLHYQGLMESSIALQKDKEALLVAKDALKALPEHPRVLTAVGLVFQHSGEFEKVSMRNGPRGRAGGRAC